MEEWKKTKPRKEAFLLGVLIGAVCSIFPSGTLSDPVEGLGKVEEFFFGTLIYVIAPPTVGLLFFIFVLKENRRIIVLGAILGVIIGIIAGVYVLPIFRL